jgi:branched-subunit amino acid aminotransferase/4-amino-4-deoxychorismate lyase
MFCYFSGSFNLNWRYMKFLIIDGKITAEEEVKHHAFITSAEFSLSQKMWYGYGALPLFSENMEILKRQVESLNLSLPVNIQDQRELFRVIKRLLNKNKLYRSGHIHLQIFWTNTATHSLITCNAYTGFEFPVAHDGLLVNFASQKKYSYNLLNRFAFFSKPIWDAALAEIRETHFQQAIILNEKNTICENALANLFMIRGSELITPSLNTGCYEDSLRVFIMETALNMGLKVSESESVTPEELAETDEVFLASEQLGINWILGIEKIRYIHYYSDKIHEKLNEFLQKRSVLLLS